MKETISNRLASVREVMRREHLAAFVFPSTDPHNSEYVPDHWKGREWISGFDGSAGTAVVTMTSAALWTDSRYFIAAAEQLGGTEFVLMKERLPETPTVAQWLGEQLRDSDSKEVGIDGMTCAYSMVEGLIGELRKAGGLTLRTNLDILAQVWTDRPPVPLNEVVVQPLNLAGEPAREKISRIRQALRGQHADGMLVTALDDIAWTLNLRGSDVHCNPVFVAYLLISSTKATLFVDRRKLTAEALASLKEAGIDVDDYGNVQKGLKDYFEYNILLDPDSVNYTLYKAASSHRVVAAASPVPAMKAVKNDAEIAGFHEAMLRDGIAMVKFLKWLKPAVAQGGQTEMSIARRLYELRSEQPLFRDISFDTIAAYQEHGAIVHYEPTEATDMPLKAEGLLLIDSGAQYQNGTTDITRTVALGPLTEEQRHVYTLVLKGHIQLDMLTFPDGASGTQLDALARKDMWAEGYNYLHGTGHGVGSYLNVHEGPHQIRMEYRPAPLHAGMTVTDEPGKETAFGKFLRFEALTLCPIDTAPIVREMMTDEEVQWLNSYHRRVHEALSPHLSDEERAWLDEATKAIG